MPSPGCGSNRAVRLQKSAASLLSAMNLPQASSGESSSPAAPKAALLIMGVIVAVMALVALYSNIKRSNHEEIETVIVTPAASPSPSATVP